MVKSQALTFLGLHVLLGVYSLSDVCSKAASGFDFLSLPFVGLYVLMLGLLGVYALGWQQVIKRMPLSSAFANRAITIVWGVFWGVLLFGESVTAGKVVGGALIIAGIVLFSRADAEDSDTGKSDATEDGPSLDSPASNICSSDNPVTRDDLAGSDTATAAKAGVSHE